MYSVLSSFFTLEKSQISRLFPVVATKIFEIFLGKPRTHTPKTPNQHVWSVLLHVWTPQQPIFLEISCSSLLSRADVATLPFLWLEHQTLQRPRLSVTYFKIQDTNFCFKGALSGYFLLICCTQLLSLRTSLYPSSGPFSSLPLLLVPSTSGKQTVVSNLYAGAEHIQFLQGFRCHPAFWICWR